VRSLKYHTYRELKFSADHVRDKMLTGEILWHVDEMLDQLSITTLRSTSQSHLDVFKKGSDFLHRLSRLAGLW
jgi:hypothetical protein